MKTLKIEHVAPYLPYDLRAIITYRPEKGPHQAGHGRGSHHSAQG